MIRERFDQGKGKKVQKDVLLNRASDLASKSLDGEQSFFRVPFSNSKTSIV